MRLTFDLAITAVLLVKVSGYILTPISHKRETRLKWSS